MMSIGRCGALRSAAWGSVLVAILLAAAVPALAAGWPDPTALVRAEQLAPVAEVPRVEAPPVDREAVAIEDEARAAAGEPWRYAIANPVRITPSVSGLWEDAGDGNLVWRLRVASPGAAHLNLGFTRYRMPEEGRLHLYSPDFSRRIRPFTAADNAAHGELWTPVLPGDTMVVEVTVPAGAREALELELGSINVGYRGFGAKGDGTASGSCNVDVVCPQGDPWRREIPSVAVISRGGGLNCTGFLVNNTARDEKPLFMTAYHCGYTSSNAPSFVAYWNYETSVCGGFPDGTLDKFTSGAFWRAAYSSSDFTLLEIDEPVNPDFGVTYAGWDSSGADALEAVAIHHPSVDEKRISFEYQPTTTTSYLGTSVPGDGTHVRVEDWDLGTTEGGSSGSPLFNQDHRVIGQLHGGYASCTSQTSDWYGKFSVSWNGGGSATSRLRDWLDPVGSGAVALDTLDPRGTCNDNLVCEETEDCRSCPGDCVSGSLPPACGNGTCEAAAGEDCLTCPADCNGVENGKPTDRFCCGGGGGTNPVGCGDARCSSQGWSCAASGSGSYCCGDGVCNGGEDGSNCELDCGAPAVCGDAVCDSAAGEDPCSCAADCGIPPDNEVPGATCADGLDNDCDGAADSADADCGTVCTVPLGGSCNSHGDCCEGKCRGRVCR